MSLPGADELFRTTGGVGLQSSAPRRQAKTPADGAPAPAPASARVPGPAAAEPDAAPAPSPAPEGAADQDAAERRPAADGRERPAPRGAAAAAAGSRTAEPVAPRRRGRAANRRPSGRERHDEKITVYVSAEELMDLEHARLVLRGEHGLAVDRGRIVREAVAVVLADLEARGDASILVRRLRGR
ncbi:MULTISPECIES: hypothetical protein [Streptomyces]|uniref:hypothetical protein n=1 Tax=Streptomyces TaxID=1883 RepID=UPI00163B8168|nr:MULTISPECIES: hypothetical protein [Streptomyces]MBC2879738.1 hypothetical protein [Streptomyces sp. TYQ1024]UBI41274.1 hypothetical protein K7I03_26210 [Streptomyces mobaraensis]UKW33774.1 hypothetical protein MCU78_26145 [Streptomyces sp. TYQ1024]